MNIRSLQHSDFSALCTGRASVGTEVFGCLEVGNAAFSSSVIVLRPELEDELEEGRADEDVDEEVREEDEAGALLVEDDVWAWAVTVDISPVEQFSG